VQVSEDKGQFHYSRDYQRLIADPMEPGARRAMLAAALRPSCGEHKFLEIGLLRTDVAGPRYHDALGLTPRVRPPQLAASSFVAGAFNDPPPASLPSHL
jgi:hypothetical protein